MWQGLWHGLLVLLISPVLEEVVFRHGIQAALSRRWQGVGRPNACTAFLFACAHAWTQPLWVAAATALPALGIGLVYAWHKSLWPCVCLHSAMNLCWLAAISPLLASAGIQT